MLAIQFLMRPGAVHIWTARSCARGHAGVGAGRKNMKIHIQTDKGINRHRTRAREMERKN